MLFSLIDATGLTKKKKPKRNENEKVITFFFCFFFNGVVLFEVLARARVAGDSHFGVCLKEPLYSICIHIYIIYMYVYISTLLLLAA